jgi:formylglycine-generating enzyme required for sulfatase activity
VEGLIDAVILEQRRGEPSRSLNEYLLPTEAEWEYACRAGSQSAYCFGDDPGRLEWFAWHEKNSGSKIHPVGEKRPNAWGLYDMHGNVWEWCQDWYGDYPSGSVSDPTGPSSGPARVQRGGSWYNDSGVARCAYRYRPAPDLFFGDVGFRVVFSP